MSYWLIKTEPGTYSWHDLIQEKRTNWDGVRNFQARNNLKIMQKGDLAFFYHSGASREIVGIAKITQEYFPDPTDKAWVAVEVQIEKKLKRPVTLTEIKANKKLVNMVLVKTSRLSVQPVRQEEFETIITMSNQP